MSFKSDRNLNIFSGLFQKIDSMFYPCTFFKNKCHNTNVEIFCDLYNHDRWYVPNFPSYVVLQSCQSLGIVVIDPFIEAPPEKVIVWVEIRGVDWLSEVSAWRKESCTREI